MLIFLACDESKGGWRASYNFNVVRAMREFGIPHRVVASPDRFGTRIDDKDKILVGDTQERRWHDFLFNAKVFKAGHKHGGRFVYLDHANWYDYDAEKEIKELHLFNKIFVNSTHMAGLYDKWNPVVTGFPFDPRELEPYRRIEKKEKRIAVNSRLTGDKNPWMLLDFLVTMVPEYEVVFLLPNPCFENKELERAWGNQRGWGMNWTMLKNLPRDRYLTELSKSRFVLNFAMAETLGLSVLEAMYLGVVPVVPDKLGYTDYVPKRFRYEPYSYPSIMSILNSQPEASLPVSFYDYKEVFRKYAEEMEIDV